MIPAVVEALRACGAELDGYFWVQVAQYLVETNAPELASDLSYDAEADTFEAIGHRGTLVQLSRLMRPVVLDWIAFMHEIDSMSTQSRS